MGGYTDIVRLLLEQDVDINTYDWVRLGEARPPHLSDSGFHFCSTWMESREEPGGAGQLSSRLTEFPV